MLGDRDPPFWNQAILDDMTNHFLESLDTALDRSHPKRKVKTSIHLFNWWTNELSNLKHQVKIDYG